MTETRKQKMPFKLYAPGTRKNNRFIIVRVFVDGRRVELSTQTTNKADAREFAKGVEREMIGNRLPRPGDTVSFAEAAHLYAASRGLDLEHPETITAIRGPRSTPSAG